MDVRAATTADVAAVREVAERSWERDYPDIVSRETAAAGVADWYDEATLEAAVERPDAVVLVAERAAAATDDAHPGTGDGDAVAGFVHGVYSDGEGHLMRVYVDPAHRGEGVGTALVEAAAERLADRGADRLRAMVLADNEAGNAFYESLGFERLEETFETEMGGEFYEECVWLSGE